MIGPFQGKYRFLSNFWPTDVVYEGFHYPTVEHAYVAAKTLSVLDRETIRNTATPAEAKRLGRKLTLRHDWDTIKLGVMESLVRQKFQNHKHLRDLLLATGTEELVELNTWNDRYWGQCPVGYGQNHLGKILMKVRDELTR